jgi:hypothetical protein
LWELYIRYGGSAGHCFRLARYPAYATMWERRIGTSFATIPNLDSVLKALQDGNTDTNTVLADLPSQLITILPDEHRQPVISLVSRHAANHFYAAVLADNAVKFWTYFKQFSSHPLSRSPAGWLWQAHVLKLLKSANDESHPWKPLISSPPVPSRKKVRLQPRNTTLPFDTVVVFGDVKSLAKMLVEVLNSSESFNAVFILDNNNTFDAFSISSGGVVIYQASITDGTHDAKATGLDLIWDAMNIAKKLLEGNTQAIQALNTLYPKHGKWLLVFVVPTRVRDSWKRAQNIDFGGKRRKRAWHKYIEQFVMVLDDHEDLGTRLVYFRPFLVSYISIIVPQPSDLLGMPICVIIGCLSSYLCITVQSPISRHRRLPSDTVKS